MARPPGMLTIPRFEIPQTSHTDTCTRVPVNRKQLILVNKWVKFSCKSKYVQLWLNKNVHKIQDESFIFRCAGHRLR